MSGWEIKGLLYQCNARTNEVYCSAPSLPLNLLLFFSC